MSDNLPATQVFVSFARSILLEDYFPKILQCMDILPEEDLWWRPNLESNSVGNLMLHLSGNVRQWIVHGLGGEEDIRDRPAEFREQGPIPKAQLVALLEDALNDAGRVLDKFDLTRILEPRKIQGFDVTGLAAIFHVVEHFSQHLGQISYITKMRKAVDLQFYDL
ncbi:MAG: DinB family protein [bacterium]